MAEILLAKQLNQSDFAPYGDVISVASSKKKSVINHGLTVKYSDLAKPDVNDQNGWPTLSIYRSESIKLPLKVRFMERHPLGSQAFMPLSEFSYLVAVAPCGELDTKAIEVFLAAPGQGINFRKGTWHHFCLALKSGSEFLVVDRGGAGDNCDEIEIDDGPVIKIENHK